MIVFAVFREGNYRQECGGIFTTQKAAAQCADALAAGDVDAHHDYLVVPFELDVPTPAEEYSPGCIMSPRLNEAKHIYTVNKLLR